MESKFNLDMARYSLSTSLNTERERTVNEKERESRDKINVSYVSRQGEFL